MKKSKNSVLVVDDDNSIRQMTALALEPLCSRVWAACGGEDALEILSREVVSLVLLDIMLPGIDGIETLERLKKSHPRTQAVMITAFGTVDRAVEAMRLGAEDFVQKPFSPGEIREVVKRAFQRRELTDKADKLDYEARLEHARRSIGQKKLEEALDTLKATVGLDPSRAEAFNLMGECLEAAGEVLEAQKNYRASLALDPTYRTAQQNLHRTVSSWPGS